MAAPATFGDVIGVAGDPLADLELVACAENVRVVVKNGALVKDGRLEAG